MEYLKNDILELLDYSANEITNLKLQDEISKVKVKNILENLRSSLEYSAQLICFSINCKKNMVYFPYGTDEDEFSKKALKNLPNLSQYSELYTLVESVQDYKNVNKWLIALCKATNIAKHLKALNIEKSTKTESRVKNLSIGNLIKFENVRIEYFHFENNIENGKKYMDAEYKDSKLNIIKSNDIPLDIDFEIYQNKVIVIQDINLDLFSFLETCYAGIKSYMDALFRELDTLSNKI